MSPSRSRTEWTRISLSIFKLLPTLRRSLALAPLEQLLQHSGQTGERSTSVTAQQLHSYSTLSLSLSISLSLHLVQLPLSVGMLTMIMKPASGRAARVAKQQVGPHSALPCPGLPACSLRFASPLVPAAFTHSHTDTQSATACSCFWASSPFVFVFGFGFVFVFRFCAAATRRGKFPSYAHLRSLRPFPALSLSLSHSLPATFVRCPALAPSLSKLCLEISLLQISLRM